jgi:hypothetical protein
MHPTPTISPTLKAFTFEPTSVGSLTLSCLNNQGKNNYPIKLLSFTREKINMLIGIHELQQKEDPSVDQSSCSMEEELVLDWTHYLLSMLQDLMNWEKWNLPKNHGVD